MNHNIDKCGFIYAFYNPSPKYNGILKIGMTDNSIETRLKQANTHTYRSNIVEDFPKWICVLGKKVKDAIEKEKIIHKLLDAHNLRIEREFFRISVQELKDLYFVAIEGEYTYDLTNNTKPLAESFTKPNIDKNYPMPSAPPTQSISIIKQQPIQPKKITIKDIHINNLSPEEKEILIDKCIEWQCIELKLFKGYYFFDSIVKGTPQLISDMRFNAVLNSPYIGFLNISSDNFHTILQELMTNSPSSFVELHQRDI
jgi:hypothetical protein